ncbi:MAG: DUF456 domain-containing protein [Muribaculaceae bacterium]|nr:DUF456 domain-containing protein [Muribaculaceae bacterium]
MTIFLITLAVVCLLTGLAGCVIPVLPGPPISYLGILFLHFSEEYDYSLTTLLVLLALVIVVTILDYVIPMLGSKYLGAGKWGSTGSFIGTIIGLFFLPWGLIVGPFLGAFIGEKISGKGWHDAFVAGTGSLVGFLVGTLIKVLLCLYMIWIFIDALIF